MAILCNDEVELVVAGKPLPDGLVARAIMALGLADRVRFATGLPDQTLARLIASAEVAVVPSLYEGFSLPAIEAMACSTPLVATRGGALPEVVGADGACGVLVAPGDAQELAAAIGALLDDPPRRAQMGEAGRRRVRDRYTWRAVAAATADCYEEAIGMAAGASASRMGDAAATRPLPTRIAGRSQSC